MSKLSKILFLVAGFFIVAMSVVLYIFGEWVPFCWVALALALLCLGGALLRDRVFFKEFFTMKTTKEGMNMGTLIVLMLAIIGLVNFFGGKYYKTFDFSLSQSNTLAPQSVQLVKNLDSELKVLFFYKKGVEGNEENRRQFKTLIQKYQDHSTKIKLDFIEVNERPDLAREYGVDKGSGVVFMTYKNHKNRIEKIAEQDFTSAIIKVTRDKEKKIFFTVGHGELDIKDTREGLGLGSLRLMLENNRYVVQELPLAMAGQVPMDADVVMIIGAKHQFQDFELTAIENYLKRGGRLFVALEQDQKTGLEKVFSRVGIYLQNNYIFNVVNTVLGRALNQGPTMGSVFGEDKITRSFGRNEVTLFRNPQSLITRAVPETVTVTELVKTTPDAVASENIRGSANQSAEGQFNLLLSAQGVFPSGGDIKKSFGLMVAGDVDFISNQMLYQNLNRDLILNSVASLADEDSLISIVPKDVQTTQLTLSETKFAVFLFGFLIPLPLLLLGGSVGLWMRRRSA